MPTELVICGLPFNSPHQKDALARVKDLGFTAVQIYTYWRSFEPAARGRFDFSTFDPQVQAIADAGHLSVVFAQSSDTILAMTDETFQKEAALAMDTAMGRLYANAKFAPKMDAWISERDAAQAPPALKTGETPDAEDVQTPAPEAELQAA